MTIPPTFYHEAIFVVNNKLKQVNISQQFEHTFQVQLEQTQISILMVHLKTQNYTFSMIVILPYGSNPFNMIFEQEFNPNRYGISF